MDPKRVEMKASAGQVCLIVAAMHRSRFWLLSGDDMHGVRYDSHREGPDEGTVSICYTVDDPNGLSGFRARVNKLCQEAPTPLNLVEC